MHSRLKGNNRPGTQNVRKWVLDNYKPENIDTFTMGDKLPLPTSFTTQTELVVDLEILRGISSCYAAEVNVRKKNVSIFEARDTIAAFANEIYSSIEDSKERFVYVGGAEDLVRQVSTEWEAQVRHYAESKSEDDQFLHHPWIAGLDVLGLYDSAALMGCRMAVNKYFLTIILHSHNAARHFQLLQEITVLEKLYNDLELAVFREPRPSSKFGSYFYRFIGSKIEIKPDPSSLAALSRGMNLPMVYQNLLRFEIVETTILHSRRIDGAFVLLQWTSPLHLPVARLLILQA